MCVCVVSEGDGGRFWGWGVSLCYFTYLMPSYPKEIGRKMTKIYLSLSIFRGIDTVWWGMKAPSCVCPVAPPSEWHFPHLPFRHLLLLITAVLPLFLSSPFSFLLPSRLPSFPVSPVLSFCVHIKGRRGLWQPLKRDRVCACPGACQAKEQRVICGITSTALNCIKQLTDLFFMTVIWGT